MQSGLNRAIVTTRLLTIGAVAMLNPPRITNVSQLPVGERTGVTVSTVIVAPGITREIWLMGPWLDYTSLVNGKDNVVGVVYDKKDYGGKGTVHIGITATYAADPGIRMLSVKIACPIIRFDCVEAPLYFNVRVIQRGSMTSITPSGVVQYNVPTTFTLHGTALDVATLSANRKYMNLYDAAIVGRTANTISIRGTAKLLCHGDQYDKVKIGLVDKNDPAGEFPYEVKYDAPKAVCLR